MNNLVFHFFKRMSNGNRLLLFILLFTSGIVLQAVTNNFLAGCFVLAAATFLLLNKGLDKRVFPERFNHNTEWKPTTREQVEEIVAMDKKLRVWDRSGFEMTSCAGVFFFFVIVIVGFTLVIGGNEEHDNMMAFMGGNLMILIIPHYFAGFKKYDAGAKAVFYARECLKAGAIVNELNKDIKVTYMTLLAPNAKTGVIFPKEVKLKLTRKGAPTEFLGAYGQLSINKVGSSEFPYFYTVLIFKPEFGLKAKFDDINLRSDVVIKEYSEESGVEVLVIRQKTTRTSGYHTNEKAVRGLLLQTFEVYEQLVK